ncbi:hypothetical protein BBJ28_00005054 [Nothophytophthora sp. Chile5]|nr:hypothetical protein BBJ28_00005054 [Nothophytophthora sp. Chile5]
MTTSTQEPKTQTMATADDSAAAAAPEVTLTQLFERQQLQEAVQLLRESDSAKVQTEITLAFAAVSSAPSAFLQCVHLYSQLQEQQQFVMRISPWIEVAVACINACKEPQISEADRALAGSFLPTFQRSRMAFVANFALAYNVETEVLGVFCARLLDARVSSAVQFMECLKMKQLLPAPLVLSAAIKQKDFRAGDIYVKDHRDNQHLFVQLLVDRNVQDKVIKKRLSLFKIDASAFPVYFERKQKATLRFLIYSSHFDDALKFVEVSEDLKMYACKMIIRHAGPEDPGTKQFVFRSGLARFFPDVDTSKEESKSFEEMADLAPLDGCLSLVSAIGEANIAFVDTQAALQACADHLMTQPVVGFDSEWKAVHISTGVNDPPAQCALVQVASREKAFVVDLLALPECGHILAPIFQSDKILKLGFDTKGDVKALRPFLTGGYATESVISMLVDMQVVTAKLLAQTGAPASSGDGKADVDDKKSPNDPSTKSEVSESDGTPRKWMKKRSKRDAGQKTSGLGLTTIAEMYLGLPLDKRARMSDWERRPLTQAQFHYAALDAHVLVQIYYKMQEHHSIDAFNAILGRCTQKSVR